MKEFQNSNEPKSKMYSIYVLFGLFIAILLVANGLASIYSKQKSSSEEMKLAQTKKVDLQERYTDLSAKVRDLKTDAGLEREIRSKFDVVKPGETMILVVDKPVPESAPEETSVIKKLWNGVVGVFKKKP